MRLSALVSRAFAARRRRTLSILTPERVCELDRQLLAEKEALNKFTAEMEEEFLELGALLRKIATLARQVRDRSDEVMAAASGRAEDAALQFAFQLLKKAEDLVQASREQYTHVFAVFERMHVELSRIARERDALVRTLAPLENTNTQFRIQACAFDENTRVQFFALAAGIREIVNDVQSAVGEGFEDLERTGQASGELVVKLTSLVTGQKRETERMLGECREHLSKLTDVLRSSESVAELICNAGAKIAGGVGKAIVALQCQDMARQKFQHIGVAIDDMVGHLGSATTAGVSRAAEADCRDFLVDAGRVQLGQLRAVFEQLDDAARQVGAGLQEVKSEAQSFADHAVRSGVAALDGEIIVRAIDSIHAVLGVIDTAVASVENAAELVRKMKSTFSDCTSRTLRLALVLRTVALNAQILAAHVDAGDSLEVIARNIRTIVEEAIRQLDAISSWVAALVDLVVALEQRLADYRELAAMEQSLLSREAGESENKLRGLERELRSAVAAIEPLERELANTIGRAAACIRFPHAVAQASARSTAFFEQIIGRYSDSKRASETSAHRKVQDLTRNYTMSHERAVHEAVVENSVRRGTAIIDDGVRDEPAEPPSPERIEVHDERLPDNIELF